MEDDKTVKRLSVIIPGFNTKKEWWQRCVASVQRAIGPDDEIIVVDDGSVEPVDLSWFEGRVTLIRQSNQGLGVARNAGIEASTGEFVTFVDSDDEIVKGVYEETISYMSESNSDIGVFGVKTIWVKERLYKEDSMPKVCYDPLLPNDIRHLSDNGLLNYSCNKVYRARLLNAERKIRFLKEGMPCEDIIFNLECFSRLVRVGMIPFVGYIYYRTPGTILSSKRVRNLVGLRLGNEAWEGYKRLFPEARTILYDHGVASLNPVKFSFAKDFLRSIFSMIRPLRIYRLKKAFPKVRRLP